MPRPASPGSSGRQLEALGIGLEVRYLRKPEDAQAVREPYLKFLNYSMEFPDPENIVVPLFQSRSVVNGLNSRYANPRLDGLIGLTEVEPSWEKRADLFRKAEQVLFQDAPADPPVLGARPHRHPARGPGHQDTGHRLHLPRRQGYLAGGLRRTR